MANVFALSSLVKILFKLDSGDWHGHDTEALWAEPVSGGRYRLRNTPFFAKGVSFEDVVIVQVHDGTLMFDSTSIAGGHSTYRILLEKSISDDRFLEFWNPIEGAGCSYESSEVGKMLLLAVDVPPSADIHEVYQLLDKGEREGVWGFEESHCGHPV